MEDPNRDRLLKMTTREIVFEANVILDTYGPTIAKQKCKLHIEIVNARLKKLSNETNKELGTHRSAPRINTLSDFKRFR